MPKATDQHSQVANFTGLQVGIDIERVNLPYFIPKECVIKPMCEESGYEADIIVLKEPTIGNEPRWEKSSLSQWVYPSS